MGKSGDGVPSESALCFVDKGLVENLNVCLSQQ